ncbi:MAG: hypothetical protein M0037_05750 [Betaproteobacteria bacterium]|nr:hypothetical protein [Betaproteobacteria bacterium]
MMKPSKIQYALIIGVYVAVWILGFSRLDRGPYLLIGLFAAVGYGSGQAIEAMLRQHIGLSADPGALLGAALTTTAATGWCVTHGLLQPASDLYLDIVERFLAAFASGHVVVMLFAAASDAVTTAFRKGRTP